MAASSKERGNEDLRIEEDQEEPPLDSVPSEKIITKLMIPPTDNTLQRKSVIEERISHLVSIADRLKAPNRAM